MPGVLPNGSLFFYLLGDLKISVIIDEIYFSRFYDIVENTEDFEVVVDLGAHIGLFTLKMAKKAKDA